MSEKLLQLPHNTPQEQEAYDALKEALVNVLQTSGVGVTQEHVLGMARWMYAGIYKLPFNTTNVLVESGPSLEDSGPPPVTLSEFTGMSLRSARNSYFGPGPFSPTELLRIYDEQRTVRVIDSEMTEAAVQFRRRSALAEAERIRVKSESNGGTGVPLDNIVRGDKWREAHSRMLHPEEVQQVLADLRVLQEARPIGEEYADFFPQVIVMLETEGEAINLDTRIANKLISNMRLLRQFIAEGVSVVTLQEGDHIAEKEMLIRMVKTLNLLRERLPDAQRAVFPTITPSLLRAINRRNEAEEAENTSSLGEGASQQATPVPMPDELAAIPVPQVPPAVVSREPVTDASVDKNKEKILSYLEGLTQETSVPLQIARIFQVVREHISKPEYLQALHIDEPIYRTAALRILSDFFVEGKPARDIEGNFFLDRLVPPGDIQQRLKSLVSRFIGGLPKIEQWILSDGLETLVKGVADKNAAEARAKKNPPPLQLDRRSSAPPQPIPSDISRESVEVARSFVVGEEAVKQFNASGSGVLLVAYKHRNVYDANAKTMPEIEDMEVVFIPDSTLLPALVNHPNSAFRQYFARFMSPYARESSLDNLVATYQAYPERSTIPEEQTFDGYTSNIILVRGEDLKFETADGQMRRLVFRGRTSADGKPLASKYSDRIVEAVRLPNRVEAPDETAV